MRLSSKYKQNVKHENLSKEIELNAIDLTETAAIACYDWIGKGQENNADQAAVTAMRKKFNTIAINGEVVIGEGERDEAPMLYIGEKLGIGGLALDIAVDPLEGTTICAQGRNNSLSVIAIAPRGSLLNAPDVYMEKIAIGSGYPQGVIDLDNSPLQNLKNLASVKKCAISEITVCILDRPRHTSLIAKIRKAGAKINLVNDGDIFAAIATTKNETGIDIYMGSGGAPEGVLAAAALACMGGQIQGRLLFKSEDEINRAERLGIKDLNFKYNLNDMIKADVVFSATGVTDGWMLKGVKKTDQGWKTHTLVTHRFQNTTKLIENTFKEI